MIRSKPLTALRAMWEGVPLELGDTTLFLLDREDGRGKALTFKMTKTDTKTKQSEDVYLGYEISFNDMLALLEKLPDETVMIMAADAALTEINQPKERR